MNTVCLYRTKQGICNFKLYMFYSIYRYVFYVPMYQYELEVGQYWIFHIMNVLNNILSFVSCHDSCFQSPNLRTFKIFKTKFRFKFIKIGMIRGVLRCSFTHLQRQAFLGCPGISLPPQMQCSGFQ